MRITQIVPSLEARHGGPSKSVLGLSEGLARLGETVELLTTSTREAGTLAAVDASPVVSTFLRDRPVTLGCCRSLDRHLRYHASDIVHNHGLWLRTLHYAHMSAEKADIPLVISPRGMMSPWAWRHRRWKKRLASWFVHPGAFQAAQGWHATSAAEADDIRALGFTQPICIAPNGVTAPAAADEAKAARRWNEALPELARHRVALFYSRFHSKKRVLELIDLWLSKPRGDWMLLVAGIPEQYSVDQLDSYVLKNGGRGRIIVKDGADMPPPYAVASLFLLPSHSENFGLVVAEALVRGVPVLTTDSTPWGELSERDAGRCVSWADYGPALDKMLGESPAALKVSGEKARTWATAAFSWDETARALRFFYREIGAAR